ncbi:MAG: hypothetical protein ABIP17_17520 [Ilumatobacteraceae bacterium]
MTPHHVVVPYASTNSSVRTRAHQWIDRLVECGRIQRAEVVVHGPGGARSPVPDGTKVLLLRNAHGLTRGRREAGLLRNAALGVYDLDDGLPWDDGRLPGLGRWWKRPFPRSLVAARAADAADRMVVGNELLADWASGHCADVRVVPTCVEPDDYRTRTSWELGDRPPLIGWIGSPATEPYLADIAGPLGEVHRRTGARLVVIGGDATLPPELAAFADKVAWRPASTRSIADWDVGIMPLRDGIYERAKCGYKLLQYAASGVPAMGSPVGVSRTLLAEMDGLAPTSHDEWIDGMLQLVQESADRRSARAASGLRVAALHSYETWQPAWLSAVGW